MPVPAWLRMEIVNAPTIEPEQSEIIPDTKAVSSNRDCVNLSERVTATYYDEEYEEWSQKTVTIRDVLDSVCEDYTVIEPERKKGRWEITHAYPHNVHCSVCHKKFAQTHWVVWGDGSLPRNFCPNCGARMLMDGEEYEIN